MEIHNIRNLKTIACFTEYFTYDLFCSFCQNLFLSLESFNH